MPRKAFAVSAVLAALSLTATPVAAAPLPIASGGSAMDAVSNYGGNWGWGGGHRYRNRGRTSAGDVLAGVLILGTIAAVANAAKRSERARSYPYPAPPYPDARQDYRPRGLEGAADLCMREVERDARARDVTRVERNASGWLVTGEMADGAPFTCSIGADGRIDDVEIGGRAQALEDDAGAYRDDDVSDTAGPLPSYPGGPLPGESADDGDAPVV